MHAFDLFIGAEQTAEAGSTTAATATAIASASALLDLLRCNKCLKVNCNAIVANAITYFLSTAIENRISNANLALIAKKAAVVADQAQTARRRRHTRSSTVSWARRCV